MSECQACEKGKFTQVISRDLLKSGAPLTLFDCDIAGPLQTIGLKGERYFLTITCRATRAIWLHLLKAKSDAYNKLVNHVLMITNQFGPKIKGFHFDNGGEFTSNKWREFCASKGIICQYTSPGTPAQNAISERLNRYIIERLISLCDDKNIPLRLWPALLGGIAHIKNRIYNSVIKITSFEKLFGFKLQIGYIRTLGSLAYVLDKNRPSKLASKALIGILVGFESSNNYLVYISSKDKIINSRDIKIKEELQFDNNKINDYTSLYNEITINLEVYCQEETPAIEEFQESPAREDSPAREESPDPIQGLPAVPAPARRLRERTLV